MSNRLIDETFRGNYPQGYGIATQSLVHARNYRYVSSSDSRGYPRRQNTLTSVSDKFVGSAVTLTRRADQFNQSYSLFERRMIPTGPLPESSEAYLAASNAFYKKAGSHQEALAQSLIESRQTLKMLLDTLRGVVGIVRNVKRGNIRQIYRDLSGFGEIKRYDFSGFPDSFTQFKQLFSEQQSRVRDLRPHSVRQASLKWSNDYLALMFGWMPLLSDIDALCNLEVPSVVPYKITRTYLNEGHGYHSAGLLDGSKIRTDWSSRELVTVKGSLSFEMIPFGQFFGLQNPWLIAWELMPWSFVIDWFLPVGKWLEYQETLRGVQIRDPSITRTRVITYTVKSECKPSRIYSVKNIVGWGITKDKRRTLAAPTVPLPRVRNPLSITHVLEATALVRQQLSR